MNFTPSLYNYFTAFWIIVGFWLDAKIFWMLVYQWRYGGNYGERYFKGLITKEEKKRLKNGRFYGKN